jgi:uncharacterized protein (UPF0332 family)
VNKSAVEERMRQARESLEEAKTLLVQDAEANFVMNSLYYAFLYPILGLLQAQGISTPTPGSAISLFEDEFVRKGLVDQRFLIAIHTAFDLRPACACEGQKKLKPQDVEQLLPIAEEFLQIVARIIA